MDFQHNVGIAQDSRAGAQAYLELMNGRFQAGSVQMSSLGSGPIDLGLASEVLLDAIAWEDEDTHREHFQHGVVALEGSSLGMLGPVRLEGHLRHAPGLCPFGGDEFRALRASTVQKDHVGMFGPDLVELAPDQAVIVEVGPAGEGDFGSCRQHHLGLGAALGGQEVTAVDQGGGQMLMVHL